MNLYDANGIPVMQPPAQPFDPIMERANQLQALEQQRQQSLASSQFGPVASMPQLQPIGPVASYGYERNGGVPAAPPGAAPYPQSQMSVPQFGSAGQVAAAPAPPVAPGGDPRFGQGIDRLTAASMAAPMPPVAKGPMVRDKSKKALAGQASEDALKYMTDPKAKKGASAAATRRGLVDTVSSLPVDDTDPNNLFHSFDTRSQLQHQADLEASKPAPLAGGSKFGPQTKADMNGYQEPATKSLSGSPRDLTMKGGAEEDGPPPRKSYRWKSPGWSAGE